MIPAVIPVEFKPATLGANLHAHPLVQLTLSGDCLLQFFIIARCFRRANIPLDSLFHVGFLFILGRLHASKPALLLGSRTKIGADIAVIEFQSLVAEDERFGGDCVSEGEVMSYEEEGGGVGGEMLLQEEDSGEVEVVCRLVEEEEVGFLEEEGREVGALEEAGGKGI